MRLTSLLLSITIVLLGLSAGFFVTYQISVMPGLALTDDVVFVQSMQGINAAVRSAPFAVIFFGPLPLLIATAAAARRPAIAVPLLAAALLYGFGLLGVTFAGNVPLNEMLATRLDAADATSARLAYEGPWNRLNAIRTGSVLAACVVVVAAAIWVRHPAETRRPRTIPTDVLFGGQLPPALLQGDAGPLQPRSGKDNPDPARDGVVRARAVGDCVAWSQPP